MSLSGYKTLMDRGEREFVIHKSRFIGHGVPAQTEEEALQFLQEMRKRYQDASHNCYAYIIGENKGIMRYSDDGEPSGTAGLPIIEVMKAREVTNCCVVVTRYFGGVLLGAGGLVRAYAQGAAQALEAAGVGEMHPTARYLMDVDYALLGRVDYFLKDAPCLVEERQFADVVTLTLVVKRVDEQRLLAGLRALSDGRLEPLRFEEVYLAWPEP